MKRIRVLYQGWGENVPIAELADTGERVLCEWLPGAYTLGFEPAPLVAKRRTSPPKGSPAQVRGESFFEGLPGFVSDALPDGWGRLLMDRALWRRGISPQRVSVLDRLQMLGPSNMGALSFEPVDSMDGDTVAAHDLTDWAAWVSEEMKSKSSDGTAALQQLIRAGGSPQGARPKVMLDYNPATRRVAPPDAAPADGYEPWLFKFPAQSEHGEVCAIEAAYMQLASKAGINVPRCQFFDLGKKNTAFGIQRFDRQGGLRVPVQSVAALLHLDFRIPSLDYEDLLRLTAHLSGDVRLTREAFARCVFNVVMHNRDDHAKNFAFVLNRDKRWVLSPAFDLTFSDGPRGQHNTTVGGVGDNIRRENVMALARRGGVREKHAKDTLDLVVESALGFKQLAAGFQIRKSTVTRIFQHIQRNVDLLA